MDGTRTILYRVIYLWHGERHVSYSGRDKTEAVRDLTALTRAGWVAVCECYRKR